MLQTRWLKVLIDLWRHRGRTLVVALAIAVGVYSVGVVLNTREMVVREYGSDQEGAQLASAILYTQPFEEDLAERIAEIPGVLAAEGRSVVTTHVTNPDGSRGDLILVALPDFAEAQVDALTHVQGSWPPGKREVLLERLVPDFLEVGIGQDLVVEMEDGALKTLTVVGTAHDPQELGPSITNRSIGFVTLETMGALGLDESYTELHLTLEEQPREKAHIQAVVDEVEAHLERTGRQVLGRRLITEAFADPFIDAIVLILSTFGILILLLSGFLVVNAITALITQQIPQIGVMKLVGARRWQIMSLYIVTVLVYGAIAIVLGIPLALVTSQFIMRSMVDGMLNVLINDLSVPLHLILVQAAVGLVLPLLAGLVPVIRGTGVTTHRALNDVGLESGGYRRGALERLIRWVQKALSLQRPVLLAIRNTLRHKGRLLQTLVVLIVGTALFISVISAWASVDATVENFMRYHGYDVSVSLDREQRLARVEQAALQVPGVAAVEGWSVDSATWQRPDGTESESLRLYAVPRDSRLISPEVLAGRWLPASVANGVVVNSDVLDQESDLRVGDDVVLDIGGRESVWHVVGSVPTEAAGPAVYVALDDYGYAARSPDQVDRVQVVTREHDAASQEVMALRLTEHFEAQGVDVSGTETTQVMRAENKLLFTIIVAFLVLMALLLAAVGGLGLTTTMSINVLERVREIGVLRAIGASSVSVRKIVLAEGLALGILSWIAGTALSVPVSAFMSEQLGLVLIQVPLTHRYSLIAAVAWFFVLLAVAVVASLGPARNAVRMTIREVLAYE
ncbi:MAG TPA: FtsX-like permease family protein [Anaerolineae bacterium]|nr:FtsX-like permease family protein [Anaerolineae bacterium]